jgi:signal transduction histidine kinase
MLMGRYVDDSFIQRLSNATHLSLAFFRYNDPQLPAKAQALSPDQIITEPSSEQTIIGVTALTDVFGEPGVVLQVDVPRTIYAQGKTTVNYFTLAMIVVALAGLAVSLIGLDRMVLTRLASLDKRALAIGASGNLSLRMETIGNDELTRLSQSINGMLESIEQIELKRRDAEEIRAHAQEDLLRAREQFSQMLVHDLKNPLTSIRGFVDMLKRTALNADQQELTDGIVRGTTHLLDLVSEILDVARLSEGRLDLRRKEVDISSLLEACAIELQPWATMDRTSIVVSNVRQLRPISIDVSLMNRVLANLVSNAIKHTPPGTKITLGAQIVDNTIQITIHDTGSGISKELQARLFERFAIVQNAERRQNSTGLGLAFCKLAVEAHGGTIQVESVAHIGTTFTILLPLHVSTLLPAEVQVA